MEKELSQMTLKKLWKLFPVSLVPHDDRWSEYYKEMKSFLQDILKNQKVDRISHIGSTAINGIWAKKIIDVLVEIPNTTDITEVAEVMKQNSFIEMSKKEGRISLNAGYTKKGFASKVFHIHLRYKGDNDELYFRDYLNEHPKIAKSYETLKLELWKKYEYNRDAYTDAKKEFIGKWTGEARKLYAGRY